MRPAEIAATCVLCAGGRGTDQVWASTRSGISRIGNSHVFDKNYDEMQMGLVPEDSLPKLPPSVEAAGLTARARRMLRLAMPVFQDVAAESGAGPVAVMIGLPQLDPAANPWLGNFNKLLEQCSGITIDATRSRVFPFGRAAGLMALEAAMTVIEQQACETVVVGGVDSFLDLRLLTELDAEGRILGPEVMDGFIPGEGAAFLVLRRPADTSTGSGRTVISLGAASISDPGHRYGAAPAKGEGLANALGQLRATLAAPPSPVGTTFAGLNGENFDSKMWGVARLRHSDFFSSSMAMQHPASCFGDTGAACGIVMTALAATALSRGDRKGPALIWAASDRDSRACALVGIS